MQARVLQILMVLVLAVGLASVAHAGLINQCFENGGDGWISKDAVGGNPDSFIREAGLGPAPRTTDPPPWPNEGFDGPYAATVSIFDPQYYYFAPQGPADSAHFLQLKTDGSGNSTAYGQRAYFKAGEVLEGYAFFDAGDVALTGNDSASVDIYSDPTGAGLLSFATNPDNLAQGAGIAQPWYDDVAEVGDFGQSDWTLWSHQFEQAGYYTVVYRVMNNGSEVGDSWAGFDCASHAGVPEASTYALFVMGLGLLGLNRSRRRGQK